MWKISLTTYDPLELLSRRGDLMVWIWKFNEKKIYFYDTREIDMKLDVTVRSALVSDLPLIVETYNTTIPGRMVTADTEPVTLESRKLWFSELSPQSRPIWVIEHQDMVCGWVSFQSFYGRPAYNSTAEFSTYIHADYRGKGLDSFLLDRAMKAFPELQIKILLGFILGHNTPRLALFERDLEIIAKRITT